MNIPFKFSKVQKIIKRIDLKQERHSYVKSLHQRAQSWGYPKDKKEEMKNYISDHKKNQENFSAY